MVYYPHMNVKSFQKIALALTMIVVLNLVFNLGVATFYASPDINNFCGEETRQVYTTQNSCEEVGGEWIAAFPNEPRLVRPGGETLKFEPYCNARKACAEEFNGARDLYNRNVFIVLTILGLISIGAGFVATSVKAISSGLLFGGLLSIIIATMRYWSGMDEYVRFVVLLGALAVLVWIGYKKLKD